MNTHQPQPTPADLATGKYLDSLAAVIAYEAARHLGETTPEVEQHASQALAAIGEHMLLANMAAALVARVRDTFGAEHPTIGRSNAGNPRAN